MFEAKAEESIQTIQNWYQKYQNQTIATTSCGATASLLIDLVSRSGCNIPIVFIDTGFLFEDTIDYFKRLRSLYSNLFFLKLKTDNNKLSYYKLEAGKKVIKDTDKCCEENKVYILNKFLEDNDIKCWFSALRRDQNNVRNDMQDNHRNSRGIFKVLPVLEWTAEEVFAYISANQLPLHPLFNLGYESIGCEPCTKVGHGRDGRWSGKDKTECGLHL